MRHPVRSPCNPFHSSKLSTWRATAGVGIPHTTTSVMFLPLISRPTQPRDYGQQNSPLFHTEEYNILGQECGRQLRDVHEEEEEDLPRGHCAMPSLDVVVRRMFAGRNREQYRNASSRGPKMGPESRDGEVPSQK